MTEEEKVDRVQALVNNDAEATDALVTILLDDAAYAIYNRLYPFGIPEDATIPPCYERLQCKLASRYFNRRGAEGEISHNENGINRTYDSVNDEDLLREVMQVITV